jgi:hypothetical protein
VAVTDKKNGDGDKQPDATIANSPQDSSEDPTAFILSRARSEVHLLLDNISANPDVTISALTAQAPPKGLPDNWIEQVCEITWPRRDGQSDPEDLAKQAALLIRTRDYLNGLAKPASGATIAFTLMVTQDTDAKARRRRRRESGSVRSPSRTSLAAEAYPDLVEKARSFRDLLKWTVVFSAVILFVTLAISWYLAVGNAALADYGAARIALDEADVRVGAAQSSLSDRNAQLRVMPRRSPAPRAAPSAPSRAGGPPQGVQPPTSQAAPPSPTGASSPPQGAAQTPTPQAPAPAALPAASSQTPEEWIARPAGFVFAHPCHKDVVSYASGELRDGCLARTVHAARFFAVEVGLKAWAVGASPETASWLANLLGSGVLPVLYGFLGAIASVVRTLSRKIKGSLLSPRDVQLTFQQLALGAVVGACISLFIAAPGAGDSDTSLLGPVGLSSAAVAFVAGFGVDSVFKALEALISRIFNIAPAGAGPTQETRAGG